RDTYYDASATMKGKLARLLTIIDESDKPELDQGALQRYLAETVWFPQALLQLQNLEWTAVDDSTALATLTDGSNPVSLHFHFDANDLVKAVSTESRYREVNGEYIPTPWRGEFSDYREVAGMLVPKKAQIIWVIDGTDVVTWRADIVSYDTSIPVD
ncbi:MAG: hypothetical protein K9N38_11345, partial [Candidatus Marinimicrobia bacterium]|nr:hypothetical protein [Candidatus Neomarinimicrobiota bacterium]MCF7851508.1 hypothetical protein [Candidatus Neomarinimicrobiota bacterium]